MVPTLAGTPVPPNLYCVPHAKPRGGWFDEKVSTAVPVKGPVISHNSHPKEDQYKSLVVRGDGLAQWLQRCTGHPKVEGFESRQEHKNNFEFFRVKKGYADSLSVCPNPVCIRTHRKTMYAR